jgi:NAD(P)-dependent dehydrogenase (short-subunit alcohol dehydrogenase family)
VSLLDGKVAIVTGAGRGLGRSHALALAAEGARVVVNDPGISRDGSATEGDRPAQQVVDEIVAAGGEAVANFDSVADWRAAEALIQQAVDAFGGLDILVNNAGILRDKMSFNIDEEDWDAVITVHLKGHFAPSTFAARYWRARSKAGDEVYGRIINTSSESGLYGNVGQVNYAAAKSGIASMTLVMARELQRVGVTVNAIAPRARTRMTEDLAPYSERERGDYDDRAPENISPVVVWLASPEAADITGQVFAVRGPIVQLVHGFEPGPTIDAGGRAWNADELVSQGRKLFDKRGPGLPPNYLREME